MRSRASTSPPTLVAATRLDMLYRGLAAMLAPVWGTVRYRAGTTILPGTLLVVDVDADAGPPVIETTRWTALAREGVHVVVWTDDVRRWEDGGEDGTLVLAKDAPRRVALRTLAQHLPEPDIALTPREAEVLQCFVDGLSYRDAADRMGVTAATVKSHARNLHRKLGTGNRMSAVTWAIQHGWVPFGRDGT